MSGAERPKLAIICNSLPPYRVHQHRRIVNEMPDVHLLTVCTHEDSGGRWRHGPPPEINPISFGPGESSDVPVHPGALLHEWSKGGRIIRFLREQDVKAVVLNGYNDAARLRILYWCRRANIPCFIFGDSNVHGDLAHGWRGVVKRAVLPRILRAATGIFACGSLGRGYFEKYGVDPARIAYVPYEPDYAQIEQVRPEQIAAVGARFSLPADRHRILFCGRLIPAKRPDLLLAAFLSLAERHPTWDLVFAGDGPLRQSLFASVPPHLSARVTCTGFIDDQAAVSALYHACDVLALPSDYEPWALVVNEAAAAGLAIVCADVVGAAAELVRDGENGCTFTRGDLAGLTRCLTAVIDPTRIDPLKAGSLTILREWRDRSDPIAGLRRALDQAGITRAPRSAGAAVWTSIR